MNEVFVFESNLAGKHDRGAALHAKIRYDAKYRVGIGRTGEAYAIPTKDGKLNVLSLDEIKKHVNEFRHYAQKEFFTNFYITAIGTGLAGYSHHEIAPFFINFPDNCLLPDEWHEIIEKEEVKRKKTLDFLSGFPAPISNNKH